MQSITAQAELGTVIHLQNTCKVCCVIATTEIAVLSDFKGRNNNDNNHMQQGSSKQSVFL